MSKISITKKTAWSLILNINTNTKYKTKRNIIEISEQFQKTTFQIRYNRRKNYIEDTNINLKKISKIYFIFFCP